MNISNQGRFLKLLRPLIFPDGSGKMDESGTHMRELCVDFPFGWPAGALPWIEEVGQDSAWWRNVSGDFAYVLGIQVFVPHVPVGGRTSWGSLFCSVPSHHLVRVSLIPFWGFQ